MNATFELLEKNVTLTGNIDTDAMDHTGFYMQAAVASARARATRDELKYALANEEARLQLVVRKALEATGAKFTEASVQASVKEEPSYKTALMDYLKASRASEEYSALVAAYDQRSYMIGNLVKLHAKGDSDMGSYGDLRRASAEAHRGR